MLIISLFVLLATTIGSAESPQCMFHHHHHHRHQHDYHHEQCHHRDNHQHDKWSGWSTERAKRDPTHSSRRLTTKIDHNKGLTGQTQYIQYSTLHYTTFIMQYTIYNKHYITQHILHYIFLWKLYPIFGMLVKVGRKFDHILEFLWKFDHICWIPVKVWPYFWNSCESLTIFLECLPRAAVAAYSDLYNIQSLGQTT